MRQNLKESPRRQDAAPRRDVAPWPSRPLEPAGWAPHEAAMSSQPVPPTAPKRPHRIEQLGRVRVDDYAWMKDDAWQQVLRDPKVLRADVREHLDAENAYTKAMLAPTEAL